MRRWMGVLLALAVGMSPASAATQVHVISDDGGGIILQYVSQFWQWREAGDTIRIEGACISACTVLLGIIEPDKVCATRNAEFGFHSASVGIGGEYSEDGTRMMWSFYAGRAARVLAKYGWNGPSFHPMILIIDAQEIVRPCKWEDYHG